MNELKFSIIILVSYLITVLGIGNIEQFQESVIDFSPFFFILIAVVVFFELIVTSGLVKVGVKLSYYSIVIFWLVVYVLLWAVYFRDDRPVEVNLIQLLLLLLSSVLTYDVGRRIDQLDKTMEGLASISAPSHAQDIQSAQRLIAAELTRSRRYHHPLSILAVKLDKPKGKEGWRELESLTNDMYERFAIAKVSKILSDLARSTDLVLVDKKGHFVMLCPETNLNGINIIADRISEAVKDVVNVDIEWGGAAFPDEALTFDDLLQTAQQRLHGSNPQS